jgi:hypothetical protein
MGPMIAREIPLLAGHATPVGALAVSAEMRGYELPVGPGFSALLPAERRSNARRST